MDRKYWTDGRQKILDRGSHLRLTRLLTQILLNQANALNFRTGEYLKEIERTRIWALDKTKEN